MSKVLKCVMAVVCGLGLAGCVNGSPAELETVCVEQSDTIVTAAGDTLSWSVCISVWR